MRVIGLDLGTVSGAAWTDTGQVVPALSATWNLKSSVRQLRGYRWPMFRERLTELVTKAPEPEGEDLRAIVFYENVRFHRGRDATHCWHALYAGLEEVCAKADIPLVGLAVSEVKKHATGKGNASKADMINAADRRWDIECDDDNHADALWVLDLGLTRLGGFTRATPPHSLGEDPEPPKEAA